MTIVWFIVGVFVGLIVANCIGAYVTHRDKDIPIDRLRKALDIADFDRQEAWRQLTRINKISDQS